MAKLPVAVQVYSVREDAEKDFKGTIQKIKDIGYDAVELAGLYGMSAQEVRKVLDEVGIRALSAHVPYVELIGDTEKTIDDYITIGCEYIAVPYLTEEYRPGTPEYPHVIEEIERIGRACKAKGVTLLYHNHDFEFAKMPDGQYALDYMYDAIPADLLQTELDICWVRVAGECPSAYIRKYAGRCPVVHLKDYYKEEGKEAGAMYELIGIDGEKPKDQGAFEFRPVGYGHQDMPSVLDAAVASGAKWVVVEQDRSVGRTPMEAITLSREYLRQLGW